MRPNSASIFCFIAATVSASPMSPVTARTRTPKRSNAFTTAPRSGASPYWDGAFNARS